MQRGNYTVHTYEPVVGSHYCNYTISNFKHTTRFGYKGPSPGISNKNTQRKSYVYKHEICIMNENSYFHTGPLRF